MCTCPTSAASGKSWAVFVLVSQLLAAVTVAEVLKRVFCGTRKGQTYLCPLVGFPTGASPGSAGLLCPRPGKMTAVLFLYFGLVLINTVYLPLLGPTTTTH